MIDAAKNKAANNLAKRIIPCLDVNQGRVVKGVKFQGLRDAGDPLEIARRYDREGADEITFLDITASHEKRGIILDVVEQVAGEVFIPLTVGGGINSLDNILDLLKAGADKVSINTAAVKNPDLIRQASDHLGSQCIVVALDARRKQADSSAGGDSKWEIYTHGGRNPSGLDVIEWAQKMQAYGAGELLLTSMDRDGTREGFDIELTKAVTDAVSIPVIASGGVGNLDHLCSGVIQGGASAVLAASIFHFGEYTIAQAKAHMQQQGIWIRPV